MRWLVKTIRTRRPDDDDDVDESRTQADSPNTTTGVNLFLHAFIRIHAQFTLSQLHTQPSARALAGQPTQRFHDQRQQTSPQLGSNVAVRLVAHNLSKPPARFRHGTRLFTSGVHPSNPSITPVSSTAKR